MGRHWRRSVQIFVHCSASKPLVFLFAFLSLWLNASAQKNIREDILLNNDWVFTGSTTSVKKTPLNAYEVFWDKVNIPDNTITIYRQR